MIHAGVCQPIPNLRGIASGRRCQSPLNLYAGLSQMTQPRFLFNNTFNSLTILANTEEIESLMTKCPRKAKEV